ncbi:MAG: aminotransferase class IV family protein [Candidatus Omnitrophica bacterium]|nr:aminotransferase class IV family protein [Candidatus Omnitrophota bacterium]
MNYLFKDGKRIAPEQAESFDFFAADRFNIFESIRTYDGIPFKVDDHLRRLGESAKTVGLALPTDLGHIKDELFHALAQIPKSEYFIRVTVIDDSVLILFVPAKQYPPSIYKKGVAVTTAATNRNPVNPMFPPAKTSNFLNQILGTLDPATCDSFEIMFKGMDGNLLEARTWNFFIVKDGVLKTPPTMGLLSGVTRKFVINLALHLGIPFEETNITRHEAYNADEAFLTNTSGEIVPIRTWDGRIVGEKIPGPFTIRLHNEYKRAVKHEN